MLRGLGLVEQRYQALRVLGRGSRRLASAASGPAGNYGNATWWTTPQDVAQLQRTALVGVGKKMDWRA